MVKKIFWDKGHSGDGRDSGAVGNGLQEHDLTHKIVEHAMDYLNDNYVGFEQRTSRLANTGVELENRDDLADNWNADVFVSVHINAASASANGFETFVYNGGVSAATQSLQNFLHSEILSSMKAFGQITDRGKKRANFQVLRETSMPAVLTENLFISNKNDATKLKNNDFLKAVGAAHARGVAKFLGLAEKPKKQTVKPVANNKTFYRVVTGSFSDRKNAEDRINALKKAGFESFLEAYKK